jgi:hypothetical protein
MPRAAQARGLTQVLIARHQEHNERNGHIPNLVIVPFALVRKS